MTDYTVEDAEMFIVSLKDRKRFRDMSREDFWAWVARRIGYAPGTIETHARGRAKRPLEGLGRRLNELLIEEIEADIERLKHELEVARSRGGASARVDVQEITALLAKAENLLEEGRGR